LTPSVVASAPVTEKFDEPELAVSTRSPEPLSVAVSAPALPRPVVVLMSFSIVASVELDAIEAPQATAETGQRDEGDKEYVCPKGLVSSGGKCAMSESSHSPRLDPNSPGLLSIGTFPPRPF